LKKRVLSALAIWGGLLILSAISVGAGIWQLRLAADTLRRENLTQQDAQDFASKIKWSNVFLKSVRYNPGVQILRVVPGISWAPQAVSAGSRVVSEVHLVLENGGSEMLQTVLSGDLTPEPGVIDVDAAVDVARNAQRVDDRISGLRNEILELNGLRIPGVDGSRIDAAVIKATDYLDLAESAVAAMKQLPQLIGGDAKVRYFVGITNEAELRGIQGIIGEFAIVEIDQGKISVSRTGSNTELVNPKALPEELIGVYSSTYGATNTEWQNVSLSPFLDPAALQITSAWKSQTGESLNGVVLLDTVALAKWAIPKVGNVESAQGRKLETWEALADYLSNGIYFEFPTDQFARKKFQSELAGKLIEAITGSSLKPQGLIRNLAKPMADGRIVAWLNGKLGAEFNDTLLARSSKNLSDDIVIGFNNFSGNKMDFYLRIGAKADTCDALDLTFTSTADSKVKYPDYLARRLDSVGEAQIGSFLGVNAIFPQGTDVVSVSEMGKMIPFDIFPQDSNRTLVRTMVEIPVGKTREFTYVLNSSQGCTDRRIRLSPVRIDD
jgi:hypothetical protein